MVLMVGEGRGTEARGMEEKECKLGRSDQQMV